MKPLVIHVEKRAAVERLISDPAYVVTIARYGQPKTGQRYPSNRQPATAALRKMSRSELVNVLLALMRTPNVRKKVAAEVAATRRATARAIRAFGRDVARHGGFPPLRRNQDSAPTTGVLPVKHPASVEVRQQSDRSGRSTKSTSGHDRPSRKQKGRAARRQA